MHVGMRKRDVQVLRHSRTQKVFQLIGMVVGTKKIV